MTLEANNFTGALVAEASTVPSTDSLLAVHAVAFDAGSHTRWRTHPRGQGLYVTDGVALVQVEGQPALRSGPGESIWIGADVGHWHGAAPERSMTRVAYQQAARDLTAIDWHEPVAAATCLRSIQESR